MPRRGQAAHGVAPLDVLDLDDLGAPVGEERRRGRHEGVLGDLEDADAFEDGGHAGTSRTTAWAMPPPAHMAATAMPPPRRRSSWIRVMTMRAPVGGDRVAEAAPAAEHVDQLVVDAEDRGWRRPAPRRRPR